MKKIIFLSLAMFFTYQIFAQTSIAGQKVNEADVPQVVKDAQNSNYSGATVMRWLKQTATRKKSYSRFVAVFKHNENSVRARYRENGTAISATTYYKAANLPQAAKETASAKHPGFTITSGEKTKIFKSGKEYLKVYMKKGASRLVIYLDGNGNEVNKNSVDEDAQ